MPTQIEQRRVVDLIPYARNSRLHSEEQIAQIVASIKEFGWTNPILVDGENGIIAGHGRLKAAQVLELVEVPVIELSGLTETQKRAYIIADNKLAENAAWDRDLLALEIGSLTEFDSKILGFTAAELDELFIPLPDIPGREYDESAAKGVAMLKCPACGHEFPK